MKIPEQLENILLSVQKPARYTGGELNSIVKDKREVDLRFAFCFPDTYEVGMSHLGMKILYSLLNAQKGIWCERVFAPCADMEEQMRAHHIPLFALESMEPLGEFDIIGFTLQYEMSYTNILNMLDLGGIPVLKKERSGLKNLVVAGGPCACNPEPMVDFVDVFFLGEGEEMNLEFCALYRQAKQQGLGKEEFLRQAAQIEGVYVPDLYEVCYQEDGTIASITAKEGAPAKVRKRIIKDLDKVFFPESFIVPYIDIVHDRAMLEVMRGCIRGCRFCQAGFIYRPNREKHAPALERDAHNLCESTGYDEISLTSLSTSDFDELEPLLDNLLTWTQPKKISLALPSLRVDNFSKELMQRIESVRKSSLTFAPEAGTQRLRNAINKNVTEEEVFRTCKTAFEGGYTNVKLYFMLGLPTETYEDLQGMVDLAQKIVDLYYSLPTRQKGKGVQVTISVSCFVPKPFTPFQYEPQDTREQLQEKQQFLLHAIKSKKIRLNYHDVSTSFLEACFAKGDRRLAKVLYKAFQKGCKFDGWDDQFRYDLWLEAFAECGIDPTFYANRRIPFGEIHPWSHLDYMISEEFLQSENQKAYQSLTTPNCKLKCSNCGAASEKRGVCVAKR